MNDAEAPGAVQKLETLMTRYGDSVLRLCFMTLRDRELARDAAQETFLKAYRALSTLRSEETEKAWLSRIAVNVCRDMQRKTWWRLFDRRITPEDLPEAFTEDEPPDSTPLLAVMNLPAKLRQVVLLHYYQGLTPVLQPKLGEYTVDLSAGTASWSLADENDGASFGDSGWVQANAFDARILPRLLDLFDAVRPIVAKYPEDASDWFSIEDAAAYDGLLRAAGFSAPHRYNHALPGAGDIPQTEAESLAVMAVCDAYGLPERDVRGWVTHTEYTLDDGGTWTVWFMGTGSYGMGCVALEAATGTLLTVQLDSLTVGNG